MHVYYASMNTNTETSVIIEPNFIIETILDDKLGSSTVRLLSNSQKKLLKTLKENDEK